MTTLYEVIQKWQKRALALTVEAANAWNPAQPETARKQEVLRAQASVYTALANELEKDPPKEKGHGLYVQHVCGYRYSLQREEHLGKKMESYGVVRLQSEPTPPEGKRWVVWYLPGEWKATGAAKGLPLREIMSLVGREIGPGEIELSTEHWGLSID